MSKIIYPRFPKAQLSMRNQQTNSATLVVPVSGAVSPTDTVNRINRPAMSTRNGKVTRTYRYLQLYKYSNQVANVFQKAGYVKGDAVALMMPNRPEYVAMWLGLGTLGVVTALINTNLRLRPLIHCLRIAKVKSIIYVEEYTSGEYDTIRTITVSITRGKCVTRVYTKWKFSAVTCARNSWKFFLENFTLFFTKVSFDFYTLSTTKWRKVFRLEI